MTAQSGVQYAKVEKNLKMKNCILIDLVWTWNLHLLVSQQNILNIFWQLYTVFSIQVFWTGTIKHNALHWKIKLCKFSKLASCVALQNNKNVMYIPFKMKNVMYKLKWHRQFYFFPFSFLKKIFRVLDDTLHLEIKSLDSFLNKIFRGTCVGLLIYFEIL